MRKFIIATLAATSLFTAVGAAHAGYWVPGVYGPIYVPTCVWTVYGSYCG